MASPSALVAFSTPFSGSRSAAGNKTGCFGRPQVILDVWRLFFARLFEISSAIPRTYAKNVRAIEPSMVLRTLIVDDEPVARKVLREELELVEGVQIIGEADNGIVALENIATQRPDLVLLDLQMPAMGGLDVVRGLKHGSHMPAIVIVTAYDKYALDAFEAGAIDYLLKPVGHKRLAEAIQRARLFTG